MGLYFWIQCFTAILLLGGTGVSAFAPVQNMARTTNLLVRPGSSNCNNDHRTKTSLHMVARRQRRQNSSSSSSWSFPNPLSRLPWKVAKQKAREERRLKQEAALLYRELGVTEDATFEEIQEATTTLIDRHKGDLKKKVRVEITKDKIMQIQLNQRLSGLVKKTSDAAATTYLEEDAEAFAKQPINWKLPGWLQGIVVKPDDVHRDRVVFTFGAIAFLGLLAPTKAGGLPVLSLLFSIGIMGQRGVPKDDRQYQGLFRTGKVGGFTFVALALSIIAFVSFGIVTAIVITALKPVLEGSNFQGTLQNMIMAFFMGLTTMYLQTYKGKSTK